VRILSAESLRFPEQGSSTQGKSGPKPRPKGVGDGQQVEIPVPPCERLSEGVTQKGRYRRLMETPVQAGRECGRQIRHTCILSRDGEGKYSTERVDPMLPRKASSEFTGARTANRHR
jgi:hypothetical protein